MGDHDSDRGAVPATRTETRISLVLYGGVSLAVYISGCCQELLSVVRATADADVVPDDELTPVERVYRRIARHRGPDGLPQRVVVDVLSGSSAGGLNAIYLAKALSHGGRLDGLREVWRREADFLRLLNPATSEGAGKGSLLDAVHFHRQLRQALADLSAAADDDRRLVRSVDCYVTATDLRGVAEKVQLDAERDIHIEELQRRAVFHFRDWDEPMRRRHDLADHNDPILAFAGRATAAHPAAFLPAQWENPDEPSTEADGYRTDLADFVSPRIAPNGKPLNIKRRWYSDGGAMDNKPFKYALEPLADRRADIPVSRKLLYIEPDPDDRFEAWDTTTRPGLAEYTIATYGLARTENIREDMEALAARNSSIERLNSSLAGLFRRELIDIERAIWATTYPGKNAAEYPGMPVKDLIDDALLGNYSPYSRIGQVPGGHLGTWMSETDGENAVRQGWGTVALEEFRWRTVLTQVIDAVLTVEDRRPDPLVVTYLVDDVRHRVETWIAGKHGGDGGEVNAKRIGLSLLDGSYRLRRFTLIEHLLGHEQLRINREGEDPRRFAQCTVLRQEINKLYFELRTFLEGERARDVAPDVHDLPKEEIRELVRSAEFDDTIETVVGGLEYPLRAASERGRRAISQADLDDDLKLRVVDAWVNYPHYDQLILPLADIARGELDTARAIRLSPLDAPSLIDQRAGRRRKLGGNALGHFGGFLDPDWRLSDITWGRLDTAEILLVGILDQDGTGEERRAAIREAQLAILTELAEESAALPPPESGRAGLDDTCCQLAAILNVNEPDRRTGPLHARAEADLRALRYRTDGPDGRPVEPEDVARSFLALLGGTDDEGGWSVDLGANDSRARMKTEIADRAVRIAGRVLANAGTTPRPGRAVAGWLGARAIRLAVPERPIHHLVRFLLPLAILAGAVTAATLSVVADRWAALATAGAVVALGAAVHACFRIYRPNRDSRRWAWTARVTTGIAAGLGLTGALMDVGVAATVVLSAQLFVLAGVAWFALNRIRALIRDVGHPAPPGASDLVALGADRERSPRP